jgi:hypothetical protein
MAVVDPRPEFEAALAKSWITANPAEAVRVLLETGALEQMSTWHEVTTPGHECWHSGSDYCRQADAGRMIPLYRLADEESTRG